MTDSLLQNLETSFFNQALKDQLLSASWFKPLTLAGKKILPIVQGGMGVGVSAHSLAGAVARENAMGTIASIDLRHHHPDLMEQTERCRDRELIDQANLIALDREIKAARIKSKGRGLIAVNVMKAVRQHPALVRQTCESGADVLPVKYLQEGQRLIKDVRSKIT